MQVAHWEWMKVYALANEYGLRVIEDAAQAFGCKRSGEVVGSNGDVICFSFDGIKNITCGRGRCNPFQGSAAYRKGQGQ